MKRKVFHCKKIKKSNIFILLTILIIIFICFTLKRISNKVTPVLFNFAEIETKKLATIIINESVNEELDKDLENNNLYIIEKDKEENISSIDFNTVIVNKILIATTTNIQRSIKYLETGQMDKLKIKEDSLANFEFKSFNNGVFYKIPVGVAFKNTFLANLGPKVPVKISLIGDILANLNNKITNYGINNALLETYIHIDLTMTVILPTTSKRINIESDVPLSIKILSGKIPEYYLNGYNQNSPTFTLPVE